MEEFQGRNEALNCLKLSHLFSSCHFVLRLKCEKGFTVPVVAVLQGVNGSKQIYLVVTVKFDHCLYSPNDGGLLHTNLVPSVSSLLYLYSGIQEAVRQSDWLFAIWAVTPIFAG